MKIAFDEHIPPVMVKVFNTLATDSHVVKAQFFSARDYAVPGVTGSDVPWLNAFSKHGGTVVISGDKRMRSRPNERQALIDAKFKVFFFAPKWNQENGFAKSALLIRW
ncbi:MAG: hypothetical protein JWR21_732 [Herminiimonas sp.]|nr:hypothetical protein [Herminiimonas sp.]